MLPKIRRKGRVLITTASNGGAEQRALYFANVKPLLASDALVTRTRRAVRIELESRTARRSFLLRTLIPSFYCLGMAFIMMAVLPLAAPYYLLLTPLLSWLVIRKEKNQRNRQNF
jgi:hypothetical protein